MLNPRRVLVAASLSLIALTLLPAYASAQMVSGIKIPGFGETFGVKLNESGAYAAHLSDSSIPGNILWPDDAVTFSFQLVNNTGEAIATHGKVDVVAYATRGHPGDVWVPDMFKIADAGSEPIDVSLPAKGFANFKVSPRVPPAFGAYGLVVDLGPRGRQFLTSCVRTFAADSKRVQYPRFCLDDFSVDALKRLGVKAVRHGVGYKPTTDKDFDTWFAKETEKLKQLNDANIAVLFMAGGGAIDGPTQPLQRHRPWLDDNAVMKETKFDIAWLPKYDDDFEKWIKLFATRFGWPKGPINAFSLWNEPWEGISISGWGADMPRYRELYTRMARGVEAARAEAGAQVLVGGCDSTANALDKLFGDGSDEFLSRFDFVSIHYQGMAPYSTIKSWVDRKAPSGRVRIWDTESWVANTDDRVAAVVAANRSAGYDRAMGIFAGNIGAEQDQTLVGDDGKTHRIKAPIAWSVAAAVGASQHFLGERPFRELLFKNGLPWVMVFDAQTDAQGKSNPDDGVVVVVGDIGEAFGHDYTLFRTVHGIANMPLIAAAEQRMAALPADAPRKDRTEAEAELQRALTLAGATLAMDSGAEHFGLYDFYGNPVPPSGNKIVIPLDGRGFFLRPDGSPGSFDALLNALRSARIDGIEPIAPVAHDLTQAVQQHPTLRLSLTNVLNRPVRGALRLSLGNLKLAALPNELQFKPNETMEVSINVEGGTPAASNTYPLDLTFDGGADGKTLYAEELHCNVIARRTINVDGKLDDWTGVLPQTVTSGSATPTLTEAAWFPFKKFDDTSKKGVATGYLAYDNQFFYFAAKVADDTPDEGMPRFETFDADEYFYPETSTRIDPKSAEQKQTLTWPQGVRRYSYRKTPQLPAGNAPNHDNVQIAFNVLPPAQKPWYPSPPGTPPGYTNYKDTDYEYALNPVAARYGGGTEIWRLDTPGMPQKHFFPRQGKSPFDGPVKDGKLAMTRDETMRIVECAIPWSEIPQVKSRLDAGSTIKFSFRVNDNANPGCMELSRNRSVAKRNSSFHCNWVEHWANELEFGFEP